MSETKIINHWIDGGFQASASDRFGNIYNPATGAVIAKLPMGGAVDLETAVKSARHAFHSWSTTSITKRAQLMFKFKELLGHQFRTNCQTKQDGNNINQTILRGVTKTINHTRLFHQVTEGEHTQ